MSADPNKKSTRAFQCRDVLWETFEQMSRELECSVDYLINEAMKQYARQRGHGQRTPFPGARVPESGALGPMPGAPQPKPPGVNRPPSGGPLPDAPPRTLPPPIGRPSSMPLPPPRSGLPAPPPAGRPSGQSPAIARAVPPPPLPPALRAAASANGLPMPMADGATLTLVYQGTRHPIAKGRFVIGRGKQSSDLTLRDPNVSRQHALIEFQNGVYFMVDMGSTNGVAYNGQRIARKQISEGDVFRICDHDIQFTYR